jgi:hypothetical protein
MFQEKFVQVEGGVEKVKLICMEFKYVMQNMKRWLQGLNGRAHDVENVNRSFTNARGETIITPNIDCRSIAVMVPSFYASLYLSSRGVAHAFRTNDLITWLVIDSFDTMYEAVCAIESWFSMLAYAGYVGVAVSHDSKLKLPWVLCVAKIHLTSQNMGFGVEVDASVNVESPSLDHFDTRVNGIFRHLRDNMALEHWIACTGDSDPWNWRHVVRTSLADSIPGNFIYRRPQELSYMLKKNAMNRNAEPLHVWVQPKSDEWGATEVDDDSIGELPDGW